ncbi:MAG TPA: PepSY-associated TM helix domain-containing protein [Methylomirabilota bacterium]|nr:PepSY-associated TM helix domain-containing protein [Methylomirabilota bacterium]
MRTVVFWTHLLVGVTAGAVILFMSVTGVLLAFEPQITEWLERDRRLVTPPPGAPRLPVETLLARAREARPDQRPASVTLRSDPAASAVVSFGREGGALFIDPYRGTVLGGRSPVHGFLHEVVEWHRWLGSRDLGRPLTGAANLGFLALVGLGVYLWWPRRWTRETVRRAMLFDARLRGRARDFNRHNVIGIWCAPVLLVITLTGLVMSYEWANNLLFTLTGTEAPPPADRPAPPAREGQGANRPASRRAEARVPAGLDALWQRAERQVPGWVAISLRMPPRPDGPLTFVIQDPLGWHPAPRSQLVLDASTGDIVKWEPFADQNLGRRLRAWVRPLHTGEAGGITGQAMAGVASAGATVLVWTGLSLAWRRLRNSRPRCVSRAAGPAVQAGQEVSAD